MVFQSLHLEPLSRADQRLWTIGSEPPPPEDGDVLELCVRPDCHETFASLRSILRQLAPLAEPGLTSGLGKLEEYLREACPGEEAEGSVTHGRLLADGVAFAVMRRISRESVYTAPIIDLAARLLNAIPASLPHCREVRVQHVDRLDRPTLKILARAMILLSPGDRFRWHWHSASEPTGPSEDGEDTYVASRRLLLQKLVGLVEPALRRRNGAIPLERPVRRERRTAYETGSALVLQNYDACFLWCEDLLREGDSWSVAEGLRLKSLAAINVGFHEAASAGLERGEALLDQPGRRAHLRYLQGLLAAKRFYDLSHSDAHYARGLEILRSSTGAASEDLALEQAWLLNGLALNRAVLWRRDPERTEIFDEAFELERRAFDLVCTGHGAARNYLRFNLIANSAFLMEMKRDYKTSIDVFAKAFDCTPLAAGSVKESLRKTLVYRMGVLHFRDGDLESSDRLLRQIAGEGSEAEQWALEERILRALGCVALERHAPEDAREAFARGLRLCREARSAEGTREHARGLIRALCLAGKGREAERVYEEITAEERVSLTPGGKPAGTSPSQEVRPSPPSPKLPAYFPEIDLEEIPAMDLNRFLADALSRDQGTACWRS